MRNFEERKAEVFRRSEKRIKERKLRRKHILMTCVPLVLCVTILGAFMLPNMGLIRSNDKIEPEGSNEQFSGALGKDDVGGVFADSVAVSGNGISNYYISAEEVQGIMRLLNSIVVGPETNDGAEDGDLVVEDSASTDLNGDCKDKGYKILIKRGDGSTTDYLLVGLLLIDQTTQIEFHMSEDTCFKLRDALGIPLY